MCVCTMQCQRLKRLSWGGILIKEKAGNRPLQGYPWPGRVQTERMCPISELYCICVQVRMYGRLCCAVLCCIILLESTAGTYLLSLFGFANLL